MADYGQYAYKISVLPWTIKKNEGEVERKINAFKKLASTQTLLGYIRPEIIRFR